MKMVESCSYHRAQETCSEGRQQWPLSSQNSPVAPPYQVLGMDCLQGQKPVPPPCPVVIPVQLFGNGPSFTGVTNLGMTSTLGVRAGLEQALGKAL